jgi:amidohydrolase
MKHPRNFAARLSAIRRDLHRNPEPPLAERRTAQRAAETLAALGWRVRTGVGGTGVVALLRGRGRGPVVALRADMDALPLHEKTGAPYRSRVPGWMHACGHDAHVAVVLGAAMLITPRRGELAGSVKCLFQPAEEIGAGAAALVRDGALEKPRVDAVLGLHVWPDLPVGTIGLRAGPAHAASDSFTIAVHGRGGHGAMPHRAVDVLVAAHALYGALQTLARTVDPLQPKVLSICAFSGGAAHNVLPDEAVMKGTLRTYDAAVRRDLLAAMRRAVAGIERMFGVRCEMNFPMHFPGVVNDEALARFVSDRARALGRSVVEVELSTGSEDFSWYQKRAPGLFFRLGARPRRPAGAFHNARFEIDEAALPIGAELLADCALGYAAARPTACSAPSRRPAR